jgi:hypothetical protein
MTNIVVAEAQAWLETTKANLGATLDVELEASIATQVLARVGSSYDTSTWTDSNTTPKLVRKIIAMKYASWYYQRQYSEDGSANDYALLLNAQAETLLAGIVEGVLELPEAPDEGAAAGTGSVEILPDPAFSMGRIF